MKNGIIALLLVCPLITAQTRRPASIVSAGPAALLAPEQLNRLCGRGVACQHRGFRLAENELASALSNAPFEGGPPSQRSLVALPLPGGGEDTFALELSPVLSPEMAARYPSIRTYRAVSIKDPSVTGRLDYSPYGFHALILSNAGTSFAIDPADAMNNGSYVSYEATHAGAIQACSVTAHRAMAAVNGINAAQTVDLNLPVVPGLLRTYRTAILASASYAQANGITDAAVTSAITSQMNRVNALYEREVVIHLQLTGTVIYSTAADQPYPVADESNDVTMAGHAQTLLTQRLGSTSWDIGEAFTGDGGGGVSLDLGTVCRTSLKGSGSSLGQNQVTPIHWINLVAHEMGHQFGADHTFNASGVAGCKTTSHSAGTAFEPGSGSTTMSYVGLCNSATSIQDLQPGEDLIFHAFSLKQMLDYTITGAGQLASGCGLPAPTGTAATLPHVTSPGNFTIPANTPFFLEAQASTTDTAVANKLTYTWDELDLGAANPTNDDDGTRPLFRSYLPTGSPRRYFPSMQYILNNANQPPELYNGPSGPPPEGGGPGETKQYRTGEVVPTTNRTLRFRVTVRDNRLSNGTTTGGIAFADSLITVNNTAGPFQVTSPNTAGASWTVGSNQTVTWNVNHTDAAPISAANVKISLSTDGGQTFPTVLAASVPNNGSAQVPIPLGVETTQARVMVQAVGNIFFDVSDANFTIGVDSGPPTLSISKTHTGNFAQGQQGATYTLTVINNKSQSTTGTVTVTDTLPSGLTLVSMSGTGWTCTTNTCTRSDALTGGTAYPAITVTVNVAANAPTPEVNQASVSGGGSPNASTTDSTTITSAAACAFSLSATTANIGNGSGTTGTSVTGSVTLNETGCTASNTWTAVSDSPRLTITSGASGNGSTASTTINFSMLTNSTTQTRTAHINVAGLTFTVTQAGSTETQPQRVVRALYQTILGREPDSGGFSFWTGPGAPTDPVSHAVLFNQMADGFYSSPEFTGSGFEALSIYQAANGTLPNYATWSSTVRQLRAGTLTTSQLVTNLMGSLSNTAFVQQVVQNSWGHAATSAEIAQLTAALSSSTAANPKQDLLDNTIFTNSLFKNATNPAFVTALYFTILVRDADSGGLGFWVGIATNSPGQQGLFYVTSQQAAYATKLAIIGQAVPPNPNLLGFLGSPEFQGLIQ